MVFGQGVRRAASTSTEVKSVVVGNDRDSSVHYGLTASSQADFSGHIRSDGFIRGTAHDLQCCFDFSVREKVQKGGLSQFDRQSLLQSVVKNGVSGLVFKIRKNDSVFLREDGCSRAYFGLSLQPLRVDLAQHWRPAWN